MHEHGGGADPALAGRDPSDLPVVALVGRPNVGKSTFLARGSGRFAETSNAPGTTVTLERRLVQAGGIDAVLVDLPGTRALDDVPAGDEPFWRLLASVRPDAILVLVDAGDLARHLPLALAVRDLGLPMVVAANLADDAARRGVELDGGRLSQLLVAPVHLTNGRTGQGVRAAIADAVRLAERRRHVRLGHRPPAATTPAPAYGFPLESRIAATAESLRTLRPLGAAVFDQAGVAPLVEGHVFSPRGGATLELADAIDGPRAAVAAAWAEEVERLRAVREPFADRFERLATRPMPGIPIFAAVTLAVFGAMSLVGGWLSALLSAAWAATVSPGLASIVGALVPVTWLAHAILWAIDGGLLAMLSVGVPYILTFYVLLAALEDSGYLTSAAVLLDRVFNALGLPGRAAVPLLAAAGCNVPALYGTRILRTRRERALASFLVTLTPCSARSAVVVAALTPFAGPAVAFAAFAVTAGVALAAGIGANALVPGRQPALVLDMARLRLPVPAHVAAKAWFRFRDFVRTAAPIMLAGSFVVGLLWESGAWAPVATALSPVTQGLLGLPAIAGVAIAFGFLRKELALQLLVALAVIELGGAAVGTVGAGAGSSAGLAGANEALRAFLTPAQLFVFALVTAVSIPCAATLATLVQELGRRAAAAITGASLGLALVVGGIAAHLLGIA